MKSLCIALVAALAVIVPVSGAGAEDLAGWRASPAGKCLMDRSDGNVSRFAAVDSNCGPVGNTSRAPRAFVLSNDFEGVIRAIRLGDPQGVKTLMGALWRTQSLSPAMGSCWKTMVQHCNAENIGAAIEAGAKN